MLEINAAATASLITSESDLASSLSLEPQDQYPQVLSTSRMIALMEIAASRVMRPLLQTGQLSVGVGVNVTHLAATPLGAEATATATFLGMEGKLYKFNIEAHDAGGLIGKGEHTRAIVDVARLQQGATKRVSF
ncbi:MAG: thioesterase family protein [Methylophilaceae bacterium]